MENSKTDEPHKFVLNFSQRLDLKSSNKHVDLQNLFTCYVLKSIRQQHKNHKLKIIAAKWKDGFELPDGLHSVSDVQDYIEYIIKNMKHYPTILPFIFTSTALVIDYCSK